MERVLVLATANPYGDGPWVNSKFDFVVFTVAIAARTWCVCLRRGT